MRNSKLFVLIISISLFQIIGCKQKPSSKIQPIDTKVFNSIEMIDYCLPIPTSYVMDNQFSSQAPKAQYKFNAAEGTTPTITFKGNILSMEFSELQKVIEKQLTDLGTDKSKIEKTTTSIHYTFERNNNVIFEKKWLLDNKETVTVTVQQSKSEDQDYFNQLREMYLSSDPHCVTSNNSMNIDDFLTELKLAFAKTDVNKMSELSNYQKGFFNQSFLQQWNAEIQKIDKNDIKGSYNIPDALEFQIENNTGAFIFIIKKQTDNTFKIVDVMGIG